MVQLMPMTESEFNDFRKAAVEEYAQDHVNAGNWDPAEALQKSEQEFQELLPQGIASPDQHLFSIVDDAGAKVGMLWFAVRYKGSQPYAFVYDFMIDEPFRRKGYGRQAFAVLDEKAKELGLASIALHVFGHNHAAIALYQAAGYEITNLHMAKKLAE